VKKGPRNLAASVRARLLRLAHERGEEFQFVLMHFVLERVLYRLSMSDRSGDFVLKGAMLLEALMDVRHRATKDLDLLGFGPYRASRRRRPEVHLVELGSRGEELVPAFVRDGDGAEQSVGPFGRLFVVRLSRRPRGEAICFQCVA
jgi:hypothetical protein